MAVKTFRDLAEPGPGTRLAVDLDFMETRAGTSVSYSSALVDASAGLTTLFSLTGKFYISWLGIGAVLANDMDHVKLTIDGVVIVDDDGMTVNATTIYCWGALDQDNGESDFMCNESLLFECETNTDTSVNASIGARAIL